VSGKLAFAPNPQNNPSVKIQSAVSAPDSYRDTDKAFGQQNGFLPILNNYKF
jgi:hypothetical protein